MTGVPQAMASIITRPKGSGQEMGKSRARAPPRKSDFSASLISPTKLHSRYVKKRKNTGFEIIPICGVHLRGDAERQARAASYLNGAVYTFLGCDAAKKGRHEVRVCGRDKTNYRRINP